MEFLNDSSFHHDVPEASASRVPSYSLSDLDGDWQPLAARNSSVDFHEPAAQQENSGNWFVSKWDEGNARVESIEEENDYHFGGEEVGWKGGLVDSPAPYYASGAVSLSRTASFASSASGQKRSGEKRKVGITVSHDLARTASMSSDSEPLLKKVKAESDQSLPPTVLLLQQKGDKKERLHWSKELHSRFVAALQVVGVNATPTAILSLMNVEGLRREQVKSHLQKFKQHQNKMKNGGSDDISKLSKRELSCRGKLLEDTIEIAIQEKARLEEKLAKHNEWLESLLAKRRTMNSDSSV
mmetsp:Transcript_18166/g.45365  ORF Transcript_18166/g.45365 Transcript_18166/m.45365 type:complete len:298 (-) Transcript_18166:1822-2715(-)